MQVCLSVLALWCVTFNIITEMKIVESSIEARDNVTVVVVRFRSFAFVIIQCD